MSSVADHGGSSSPVEAMGAASGDPDDDRAVAIIGGQAYTLDAPVASALADLDSMRSTLLGVTHDQAKRIGHLTTVMLDMAEAIDRSTTPADTRRYLERLREVAEDR